MKWANETELTKQNKRRSQVQYEEEMLMYSRSKYWDDYDRSPDEGLPEQQLLDSSIKELAQVYQEWTDKVVQNPKSPNWLLPLLEIGSRKMADITIRAVIRSWFSSGFWGHQLDEEMHHPPLAQTISTLIAKDAMEIIAYQRAKTKYKDDWSKQSKFIKNWTPKRCRAFTKKVQENIELSVKQKHDFGHHMIRIAATSNIIMLEMRSVKRGQRFKRYSFVEFHKDVLAELHQRHELLQASTLVYRPMISPPELHTELASGGYIRREMRKPMVQRFKSSYFDDQTVQKFSKPSKRVINSLNGLMLTEWAVNEEVKGREGYLVPTETGCLV